MHVRFAILTCEKVHRTRQRPRRANPIVKTAVKAPPKRLSPRRVPAEPQSQVRSGVASPQLLTLAEAAMHLGHVHRTTIMRWVREGRLKCIRLSRKAILFEPAELERFVSNHRYSGS